MLHLKQNLSSFLSNSPERLCVKNVATLCHQIALIYLRQKAKTGRLRFIAGGMSREDFATDAIAELFQRDEQGRFVKFIPYFHELDWEHKSEEELLAAMRRLVFGKVNQSVCRFYREADPSLGKLLRNLKIAVKASPRFLLVHKAGEAWLSLAAEETPARLPVMPPEFLEAHLMSRLRGEPDVKQILALLAEILAEQETYRKGFPLTGLALIIRSTFTNLHVALEQESNGHEHFAPDEIVQMIAISAATTKSRMHASYVGKNKVEASTFAAYFVAIQEALGDEYIHANGISKTYFEHLRRHLPQLAHENYRKHHRCHFEYLAKLTRKEFLSRAKKSA